MDRKRPSRHTRTLLLLVTTGLFLLLTGIWLTWPETFAARIDGASWTWAMASGLAAWAWFLIALVLVPRMAESEREKKR